MRRSNSGHAANSRKGGSKCFTTRKVTGEDTFAGPIASPAGAGSMVPAREFILGPMEARAARRGLPQSDRRPGAETIRAPVAVQLLSFHPLFEVGDAGAKGSSGSRLRRSR